MLREFFLAALVAFPSLHTRSAVTVLAAAPTPTAASALTEVELRELLHIARRYTPKNHAAWLREVFAAEQLHQPPAVGERWAAQWMRWCGPWRRRWMLSMSSRTHWTPV